MNAFYNILQILLAPLGLLLLPIYLIRHPGKGEHLARRLGRDLPRFEHSPSRVIWIHALSVGEVTSALPLVQALRFEYPEYTLVFSATTSSGRKLAESLVRPFVDAIIPFPLDILPVVRRFIKRIAPQLFILIETDFWPNLLFELARADVPAVLVNGRISSRSMRSYQRFSLFFRPLFNQFRLLCMQTKADTRAMQRLGIAPEKLRALGNLKCADPVNGVRQFDRKPPHLQGHNPDDLLIICGSTHPGEEQIILEHFQKLAGHSPHLHLILAPRSVDRCQELIGVARSYGFAAHLFSDNRSTCADPSCITIIDTIGDLAGLYQFADIAFIGGSLVPAGGHNPLEAARHSCPILFGPHMDDFSEIRDDLISSRGAFEVRDGIAWGNVVDRLVQRPYLRRSVGNRARMCMQKRGDVVTAHVAVIRDLL